MALENYLLSNCRSKRVSAGYPEGGLSRRRFLSMGSTLTAGALLQGGRFAAASTKPDIVLHIASGEIEVAAGHIIRTVTYNGSAPGPLLVIPEGKSTSVEIHNESSNREYIHWHGFSLDAALDGTPEENSLSVEPSSQLNYLLPPQVSGSYYVHSHAMAHGDMGAGMYGGQFAFVHVRPARDAGDYDQEIFLSSHEWEPYMVNEAQEERSVEEMYHLRIDPEESEALGEGGWDIRYRLASLNGKALGHGEPIRVKQGERLLLHLLNASATENLQVALPGHEFLVQAMDGRRVPNPTRVAALDLGVGERIDAIVEMTTPGAWILGSTDETSRSMGLGIVIEYAGRQGDPIWVDIPAPDWDYTLFGSKGVERAAEEISIALHRLPLTEQGTERWEMSSLEKGGHIPAVLFQDKPYRLRIRNESNEWHPMHLHRHVFELTRFRGRSTAGLMKDTVVVPPYDEVEMLLTPRQTGPALFHCHNQMHMDAGLQTLFTIS
jgi:FtsP/CotA-like multicopper oxidase with cupredoxin domain